MAQALVAGRARPALGGLAGVFGVVVPAIGLLVLPIWRFPATTASGAEVSRFVAEHRSALQATMALYTAGVTLWLLFGAVVWARLRAVSDAESVLPSCYAAGLTGFVTLLLAGFTAFDVAIYRRAGAGEARLLYDLTFALLAMSGMPTAIAMGAFAISVYRDRWLPRYTADLAALTALAHAPLLLSFVVGSGFFSLEGAVITVVPAPLWAWNLMTGLALLRGQ